ncbi:uncharacterized protein LOC144448481 [Glandiceps talaboti]
MDPANGVFIVTLLVFQAVLFSVSINQRIQNDITPAVDKSLQGHHENHISISIDKRRWMTSLYNIIKNKNVSNLIIPGTHDSGTFGITSDNGYLVDKSFNVFYDLGLPELHLWSRSQTGNFTAQLEAGMRYLDMRIAAITKGGNFEFYWWHGLTGDRIEPGLQEIANFAKINPGEILILEIHSFAIPGNSQSNTLPMTQMQKKKVSDLIFKYLGSGIVPSSLGNNPTVQDILASKRNIMAYVDDDYVIAQHQEWFRKDVVINGWVGENNPEDVFNSRCEILNKFHTQSSNDITVLSSCVTPDTTNVIGGLFLAGIVPKNLNVYAPTFDLTEELRSNNSVGLKVSSIGGDLAKRMGFQGVAYNLLDMTKKTNSLGMNARDPKRYSSIGSVQFEGSDHMIRYWLARPNKYKPNMIEVDDFVNSNVVSLAILANSNEIPREVSISFQGNTRDGYVKAVLDIFYTDGDEGLHCTPVMVAYTINSTTGGVLVNMSRLKEHTSLNLREGQYPKDGNVTLFVSSSNSKQWYKLYSGNIQQWITTNHDVYIRGSDPSPGHGSGFAYVSTKYNDFGPTCSKGLKSGVLNYVEW